MSSSNVAPPPLTLSTIQGIFCIEIFFFYNLFFIRIFFIEAQDFHKYKIKRMKSLYDFQQPDKDWVLSFNKGEIIEVLEQNRNKEVPNLWWQGKSENSGKVGIFPANYCEIIELVEVQRVFVDRSKVSPFIISMQQLCFGKEKVEEEDSRRHRSQSAPNLPASTSESASTNVTTTLHALEAYSSPIPSQDTRLTSNSNSSPSSKTSPNLTKKEVHFPANVPTLVNQKNQTKIDGELEEKNQTNINSTSKSSVTVVKEVLVSLQSNPKDNNISQESKKEQETKLTKEEIRERRSSMYANSQKEHEKFEKRLEKEYEKRKAILQKNKDLKRIKTEQEQEIGNLSENNKTLLLNEKKLQGEIESLKNQMNQLQKEKFELEQSLKQQQILQQQPLPPPLKEIETEGSKLRSKLNRYKERHQHDKEQMKQLHKQLKSLSEKEKQNEQIIQERETLLKQLREELHLLKKSRDSESIASELVKEYEKLQRDLENERNMKNELASRITEYQQQNEKLKVRLRDLGVQQIKENVEASKRQLETEYKRRKKLESKLEDQREQFRALWDLINQNISDNTISPVVQEQIQTFFHKATKSHSSHAKRRSTIGKIPQKEGTNKLFLFSFNKFKR